ncbi:MAG TPA: hypothetical protein DHV36_21560 [Desulfobacteraceae bacterium]|nr:hypothetical protein [Desulfobacteraceae bacterium]
MKAKRLGALKSLPFLLAVLMLIAAAGFVPEKADAGLRTRVAVLPFYVEQGQAADTAYQDLGLHYRRMSGFIENHLREHDFDVVDPFARDASEKEFNRVMQRASKDSILVATNMCQRFAVDAIYIVWLKVKTLRTSDGYTKAVAIVDGKGYDSAGHSLGANMLRTFQATRRDHDDAVATVEREVGDDVGRILTTWHRERGILVPGSDLTQDSPGILAQEIDAQEKFLNIRLSKATEYELVEAFGKVLITVRGVRDTKQYSLRIVPDNPQACLADWKVEIDTRETDPFRLQANIIKMVNDILDAGGTIRLKGIPYRYTPSEMRLMMGLMPGEATTRSIRFMVDRERARQRELAGRHDPRNAGFDNGSAVFD